MPVVSKPAIRQVRDPTAPAHRRLFPAALAAGPTVAAIDVIAADGYEKIHCKPEGTAPEFEIETGRVTEAPGLAVADDRLRLLCANRLGQARLAKAAVRMPAILAMLGPESVPS